MRRFTSILSCAGFASALIAFVNPIAHAQSLNVTGVNNTQTNANALVDSLLGPGIARVGNAIMIGASGQQGTFTTTGTGDVVGFTSGVILTTGSAAGVVGPNNSTNTTTITNSGADATLGGYDANSLTFDFTVGSDITNLQFQYVFGSEEYPEYVGSAFNDRFAFYVNGTNVALIPGTSTAVAINSINAATNSNYYRSNTGSTSLNLNTQLDGLTTVLTASVSPYLHSGTNTIKMVITDQGDAKYDSAVFIRAGSFTQNAGVTPNPVPEPGAVVTGLSMVGMTGLGLVRGRRRAAI